MTPNRTRAEQIAKEFCCPDKDPSHLLSECPMAKSVEQALDEAVRDDRMERTADDIYKSSYKAGTLKGLEMAAGIADGHDHCCDHPFNPSIEIANEIRARAKELEGK